MAITNRPNKPIGGSGGNIWLAGVTLYADELNADIQTLYDDYNGNITDANCSASMALQGTKLADAPNGIPTAKYNDKSITGAKIANDAAVDANRAIGKDHLKNLSVSRRSLNELSFSQAVAGLISPLNAVRYNTGWSTTTVRPISWHWQKAGALGAEALATVAFILDTVTNTWWIGVGNPSASNMNISSVTLFAIGVSD